MARRRFHLDIREFVGFVHRTGNLGGSGAFQVADRAVEGSKGHRRLQKSRGETYQAEVPVEFEIEQEGVLLVLRGRLDGMMPLDPILIEEIKTVDSRWNGESDPVHFAQLRAYASILARQNNWAAAQLQLTYLDYETDQTTIFREQPDRATLDAFLDQTLAEWFSWLIPHANRLDQRDASAVTLAFPFPTPRAGQLNLARTIYQSIRDRQNLFLEAPTGLGKTVGALFPAVKALPLIEDGKIFYLTAKTPGRQIAEEAVLRLQNAGAQILAVNLTAKGKICFSESPTGCDLRICPYALGYHDRIKPALRELLKTPLLDRTAVEAVGRSHQVCPFELSLDATLWTDVIICDYNYVFDPAVRLQRHFAEGPARHVVLVDEAHNLPDRSREMFSASLSLSELTVTPGALSGKGAAPAKRALLKARDAFSDALREAPSALLAIPSRPHHEGAYATATRPDALLHEIRKAGNKIEAFLAQQEPGQDFSAWLEPFFAIQRFLRTADDFDSGTFTLFDDSTETIKLFCVDPRERMIETLKGLRSTIFFSATLSPLHYFRDLLGGDPEDRCRRFPSPFQPDQMKLRIEPVDVSFRERSTTLAGVARLVREHLEESPGNHLIFCPSRDYLVQLEASMKELGVPVNSQVAMMTEAERSAFLERLAPGGCQTALAVMGGIFAEGVDLRGDRLVGVTVIGVGLPRLSLERDLLQQHFQNTRGSGYDYAYRFPGMQRVIQAVGRLIRTEDDRGTALLIDRRFQENRYRELFPSWWIV